jgi:hypothetical protein
MRKDSPVNGTSSITFRLMSCSYAVCPVSEGGTGSIRNGSLPSQSGVFLASALRKRAEKNGASHEWHCRAEMSAEIGLGLAKRIF